MIAAYIEQQEKALPKDVFKVSDKKSASAEMTDFQSNKGLHKVIL